MTKFLLNILKFSAVFLFIPVTIFLVDPIDYFDHPLKLNTDRNYNFRRFNGADWAFVEVSKIDERLKDKIKTCAIGDSRGRMLISGGAKTGWQGRICGVEMDVLDLSFGGAQLKESISLFKAERKNLDSLERVIISLAVDKLLMDNSRSDRVQKSKFNSPFARIKYLSDVNLLDIIFKKRNKIKKDISGKKAVKKHGKYNNSINAILLANQNNPIKIKKRNDARFFKRKKFKKGIVDNSKINNSSKHKKIRKSFLEHYENSSRSEFDKKLSKLKSEIIEISQQYEVIIIVPPYDDILYNLIQNEYGEDYNYYLRKLKEMPCTVINLQDISNEFTSRDPVHRFYLNGSLVHKLIHEHSTLIK